MEVAAVALGSFTCIGVLKVLVREGAKCQVPSVNTDEVIRKVQSTDLI